MNLRALLRGQNDFLLQAVGVPDLVVDIWSFVSQVNSISNRTNYRKLLADGLKRWS